MKIIRFGYSNAIYAVMEWNSGKTSKIYFGVNGVFLDGFDKSLKDKIRLMILEEREMLYRFLYKNDNLMETERTYAKKLFKELETGVKEVKKFRKLSRTQRKWGVYI